MAHFSLWFTYCVVHAEEAKSNYFINPFIWVLCKILVCFFFFLLFFIYTLMQVYRETARYTLAYAAITAEWRGCKPIKWKLHPRFTCLLFYDYNPHLIGCHRRHSAVDAKLHKLRRAWKRCTRGTQHNRPFLYKKEGMTLNIWQNFFHVAKIFLYSKHSLCEDTPYQIWRNSHNWCQGYIPSNVATFT